MDIVINLLAGVGFLVVLNYAYRWCKSVSKYNFMMTLIKRYDKSITVKASTDQILYGKPSHFETIPRDIYSYCMEQSISRNICLKHRATAKDFREIYMSLVIWCPYTIKEFFIPVAAFFFYSSLDYVLTNKDNLNSKRASSDLIKFFEDK